MSINYNIDNLDDLFFRGLDLLQQLQHSSTRRNPVVDMAWSRLLNSNLPAKYALIGELSFDNTLDHLFYDVGKVKTSGSIVLEVQT